MYQQVIVVAKHMLVPRLREARNPINSLLIVNTDFVNRPRHKEVDKIPAPDLIKGKKIDNRFLEDAT